MNLKELKGTEELEGNLSRRLAQPAVGMGRRGCPVLIPLLDRGDSSVAARDFPRDGRGGGKGGQIASANRDGVAPLSPLPFRKGDDVTPIGFCAGGRGA